MIAGSNNNAARSLPKQSPRPQVRPKPQSPKRTKPAVKGHGTLKRAASIGLVLVFFALFSLIVARYAEIEQMNGQMDTLKKELNTAQKETAKIAMQANFGLNLDEVQQRAGTELNMRAPGKDSEVYVTLPEVTSQETEQSTQPESKGVFDLLLGILD